MLLLLREVGLGVDEGLEIEDGETGWEVKVEELLVEGMIGSNDRYGNSRPRAEQTQRVNSVVAVVQDGSDSETAGR